MVELYMIVLSLHRSTLSLHGSRSQKLLVQIVTNNGENVEKEISSFRGQKLDRVHD